MRSKKSAQPIVVDQAYLSTLFQNIMTHMSVLDGLNQVYKNKQEEHFLKTFMNVIQKIGNDLIIAQQAYRNVDIQIKTDQYCLELAEELSFFKNQCFTLRGELKKFQEQVISARLEKQNSQCEVQTLKQSYEKKMKENMKLLAENKQLKKQIKILNASNNNIFKYTTSTPPVEGDKLFLESNIKSNNISNNECQPIIQHKPMQNRLLVSQQGRRLTNYTVMVDKRKGYATERERQKTPNSQIFQDFDIARKNLQSTNPSFRRKSYMNNNGRLSLASRYKQSERYQQ